jgi:UDP-glucose 4-epimerase
MKHSSFPDNFQGKTLLITGGTGSFGQEMAAYFLEHTGIARVLIFSRDEEKQDRMRHRFSNNALEFIIGDVRDCAGVAEAVRGVDFVFHAAALKQVPSCEFYPLEAVRTNVLGASNVVAACVSTGVKNLVALSTDKAVHPINAMGMTKALMEKIVVSKSRITGAGGCVMCATRYGNVMASRGSVIPLFVKQCKEGKPLTITDPGMTRFLMSLEESVNLVLFAFLHARPGDIFIQKAPAVTIYDLALAVKEIFKSGSEIKIIGTRHGEKKHETLISREEMIKAEDMGGFYRIPADSRTLNYEEYFECGNAALSGEDEYTSENTARLDAGQVAEKLLSLDYVQRELASKEYLGVAK